MFEQRQDVVLVSSTDDEGDEDEPPMRRDKRIAPVVANEEYDSSASLPQPPGSFVDNQRDLDEAGPSRIRRKRPAVPVVEFNGADVIVKREVVEEEEDDDVVVDDDADLVRIFAADYWNLTIEDEAAMTATGPSEDADVVPSLGFVEDVGIEDTPPDDNLYILIIDIQNKRATHHTVLSHSRLIKNEFFYEKPVPLRR